jgi:hypothetical protein
MGTSAAIRFKYEGDNPILVNVYHHYDGYIEGVGHDLAEFLLSKKIVNGITCFDDMNAIANGFSCLIAQYISNVKKAPGEVYIYPQNFKGDYNYDVVYNDCKNEIHIKVTHYDKVLFKGSPKELLEYKDKEEEDAMQNKNKKDLVLLNIINTAISMCENKVEYTLGDTISYLKKSLKEFEESEE